MENEISNTILLELQKISNILNNMEKRIDNLEQRIDSLEKRIDSLEKEMKNKFQEYDEKFNLINARFNTLEEIVLSIQSDIDLFHERMSNLERITLHIENTFNDEIAILFDAHSYYNDQYQKLLENIRKNENKIANLSMLKG